MSQRLTIFTFACWGLLLSLLGMSFLTWRFWVFIIALYITLDLVLRERRRA